MVIISSISIVGAESLSMDLRWSYLIPEKIDNLYIEDIDNDGFLEIVIVAKGESYSSDKIYVLDKNGLVRWAYELDDLQSVCVSDTNHDLFKEIVLSYGRIREGIGRGGIYIIDKDGELLIEFPVARLKSSVLLETIVAIDLDKNGYEEIIGNTHDTIFVLKDSYDDFSVKVSIDKKIYDIFVEDLNRDGYMDVIARSIYDVYDVSLEGLIKWHCKINESINTAIIANLYHWGNNEVVLTTTNDTIYVLDDSGILRVRDKIKEGIITTIPVDFDDDGFDELVFGTSDGVYFLDMDSNISYEYKTNSRVNAIFAAVLEKKSELEIFASDGINLYEISRDGSLLNRYKLRQNVNKIYLRDLDNDGVKELVTSSDNVVSVYGFGVEEKGRDRLAKGYYDKAYLYLNVGYLENATFYAEKAFTIYSELNDSKNIRRCEVLIQRIEDEINRQMPSTTTTSTTTTSTSTIIEMQPTFLGDYGVIMVAIIIILALVIAFLMLRIIAFIVREKWGRGGIMDYEEIVGLSVKDAKKRIMGIENPDYDKIIEIEKVNKNRKGFIGWLGKR